MSNGRQHPMTNERQQSRDFINVTSSTSENESMTYFWSVVDISRGVDDLRDVVVEGGGGQTDQTEQL